MKYYDLNDGNKLPAIGFGTYKITDEKDMDVGISSALDAGYTYFDTAKFYENEKLFNKFCSCWITNAAPSVGCPANGIS